MPAKSKKQFRYVQFLKNKYGTKSKAPEKDKWAFEDSWTDANYKSLPEGSKLKRYKSIFTHYDILSEKKDIPKEIALKFGNILFGDFRKKGEEDTEYEKKIFQHLVYWVQGEYMGTGDNKQINKIVYELKKLKNIYPKILKPNTTNLYRLIEIDSRDFFKKNIFDFEKKDNRWYSKNTHKYEPFKLIQSWTSSEKVAFGFLNKPTGIAINNSIPRNLALNVVINHNFNEQELLFNTSFLNSLSYDVIKMRQNEILHIDKKIINCTYIFDEKNYKQLIEKSALFRGKNIKINYKNRVYTVLQTKGTSTIEVEDKENNKGIIKKWSDKFIKGEIKIK